ncbi:succinate dehydrogenase, cytochrome b556 subunit [Paracoccus marinaquae]|uniref:Succinate dehydrogenase cytochrome b556 subunit n=1 Tax=Paracoccus marinaquae TaxID=2841926 RepID=A0ABS6AHG7_9RHOB|nr:succinate dehydrogenase, cytochrome b556 subunit [Paracoccus marinaquae]MBU3029959.1 succinate dehydrogenase, cytochrome b556 subunit [Paracoccus marinaquae]
MADVNRGNRPLSPHLQVYKLPVAAVTSILTRITGHALVAGILLVVWWLVGAVSGPGAFAAADWVVRSWLGFLILAGSAWALWYHTLAGIRHLFYDALIGLEIESSRKSSWAVIVGSVVLTLFTLILFFIG